MNIIDISNKKFSTNREEFRKELITIFLDEKPGKGKAELASRYNYIVKHLHNHEIYLQRPAQFNNGFDFTLNVSGINFNENLFTENNTLKKRTTRPSHEHILSDLGKKKNENQELYSKFLEEIKTIYNSNYYSRNIFPFTSGYNSEITLECIKWLFAEQDITYWNYSGREMLFKKIFEL